MLQDQDQASEGRDSCQGWELMAQRGEMGPLLCGGLCRGRGMCDRHSGAWQTQGQWTGSVWRR